MRHSAVQRCSWMQARPVYILCSTENVSTKLVHTNKYTALAAQPSLTSYATTKQRHPSLCCVGSAAVYIIATAVQTVTRDWVDHDRVEMHNK